MAIGAQAAVGSGERARQALLYAGARLLERGLPSTDLTVSSLSQEARVDPGAYYLHFSGPESYHVSLLQQMLDEVRVQVTHSMSEGPPGRERARRAISTYLDASLNRPGLRSLLAELRFSEGARELLRARTRGYTTLLRLELEALQWPLPAATAHLFIAMTQEVVIAESEAGRALPDLREVLFGYLDRH